MPKRDARICCGYPNDALNAQSFMDKTVLPALQSMVEITTYYTHRRFVT
jgi:hypothetical protein